MLTQNMSDNIQKNMSTQTMNDEVPEASNKMTHKNESKSDACLNVEKVPMNTTHNVKIESNSKNEISENNTIKIKNYNPNLSKNTTTP